jgi:tRNA(adenine34) deaminase
MVDKYFERIKAGYLQGDARVLFKTILARTAYKLVIRWWNPCSTLDACQRLGLNTREICHKVYCRPVQELIQKLDPRLKFTRNYAAIRPYTPYCEEIIYLEA